jgi:YD repeat-containing protein
MAHLAHSLLDDGLIRPETRRGRLALFARAANDNAPPADQTLTAWGHDSWTSYTPTGKVAQTTDPLGEASVTTYDAADRPVFVTDAAGHVSGKTYDLAGEELSETSGVGTPIFQTDAAFTYGADGEKLSVTDANSNTTQLAYDGFNRLSRITYADQTTEASQYDKDGDLTIWTNRGGYGVVWCGACPRAGQRPDPGDALNRVVSESGITGASSADQTLACPTGRTTNTQPGGISPRTFTYDLAGRLTGAAIQNFPPGYTYDAAGLFGQARPLHRARPGGPGPGTEPVRIRRG